MDRLLAVALLSCLAFAGGIDVRHYDLDVTVEADALALRVTLHADVPSPPARWRLDLADRMKVERVEANGRSIPFVAEGNELVLDLSSLGKGALEISFVVRGSPYVKFSPGRGGFLRTVVSPTITHIRKQYPWYPRARDDPATYRTAVHAPDGWLVRTTGTETAPGTFVQKGAVRRIGLVAGPYELVRREAAGSFVLDAFMLSGGERAGHPLEVARRALEVYAGRFGASEAKRFTLVEMPEAFGPGSGYGEGDYVLLGAGAFQTGRAWADALVAHEVAHTWWGHELVLSDFASEALASYAALGFVQEDEARDQRRSAVERISKAPAIHMRDVKGFGGGMDPATYRAHAYEKGMMILFMAEEAIGRPAMDTLLRGLIEANRGKAIGYADLHDALARKQRTLVDLLEEPGLVTLAVEHTSKRSGKKWKVKGKVTADRPKLAAKVLVRAQCGGETVETTVRLSRGKGKFSMTTPEKPDTIVIDPDYRLLALRPESGIDAAPIHDSAVEVMNSPNEGDPRVLEETIARLRGLLRAGAGDREGLYHTGIGRCLFRLDRRKEAKEEFEAALKLGAGGPFHRAWIYLRLGCLADLEGDRKEAERLYRKAATGRGASAQRAQRFLKRPYRGYSVDG